MGYKTIGGSFEKANKTSHFDIVNNPDVAAFKEECNYVKPPQTDEEGAEQTKVFQDAPPHDKVAMSKFVIAIDGSRHESSLPDGFPATRVGYVKVTPILIALEDFAGLLPAGGRFVDPFRVAEIVKDNASLTFEIPSSNVKWKYPTVRESFRARIDNKLMEKRIVESDPATNLRSTIFHLAARRTQSGTGDPTKILLHKCPSCEATDVEVRDIPDIQTCPSCGKDVFPSDCLRLWEEVFEEQSNLAPITRFMNLVEHILPIAWIRYLLQSSPSTLGEIAFFVDHPLAIHGTSAWLHRCVMKYLYEVNNEMRRMGMPTITMIGLQKTGQVADFANAISRFVKPNTIFPIEDEYRYRYIISGRTAAEGGTFGIDEYYGQDFIYKTTTGRIFIFGLPYPFEKKPSKGEGAEEWKKMKIDMARYENLPKTLALIDHFESDLYENAVVPIALAHRHAAISLVPGAKALDILTRKLFEGKA